MYVKYSMAEPNITSCKLWLITICDWSSSLAERFGSLFAQPNFGYVHFTVEVHVFLGANPHLAEPTSTAKQASVHARVVPSIDASCMRFHI
jgi:hypothetical protein